MIKITAIARQSIQIFTSWQLHISVNEGFLNI